MWGWIFGILGVLVGASVVVHFWDTIRDYVAGWLRNNGLSRSALMDAWILLDQVVSGIRCRLYAKRTTGRVESTETVFDVESIDDQEVLNELKRRGMVKRQVLEYVN
jgi:hypothetical protein